MRVSLPSFLFPPKSPGYEQTQKVKLLHVMQLAAFLGALAAGIENLLAQARAVPEAISLFLLAGVCLVSLYLNHTMRFDLAAFVLCASILLTMDYALYEGASLHDTGVVAYPVFILCTTFLFGRRGLFLSTFLSIASVAALYLLEVNGISTPSFPATLNRVLILSLLFIVTALVTWVVRDTWETHLMRLRESYDMTLQGWARALEYRDGETEGHSQRATRLCVALARKLGCAEEDIRNIRRGAYLHDIGKMAIPDRILFKPGPLDDEEWEIMKQHPVLALKLISEIPFLKPAIGIPYSHHEHWDGTGYPEGLKGEEIPLAARIFTVVDHWDALSSDRPYRQAWAREKIISHLQGNAGKIYDPQIVDAFLTIIRESETDSQR